VEDAATHSDTNYALGSVLNHVMLHQTVIGQEAKLQMEMAGEEPDVVIGCFGGGSNFAGLALPYVLDRLAGKGPRIVAVEPSACPSLTKGTFAYDYGDTAKLTPLIKMYTLGHDFVPPGIHAGGLRYHGASPLLSHLLKLSGTSRPRRTRNCRCSRRPVAVRAHRGNSAGARIGARHPRRHGRSPRRARGRQGRA
jgi:tryptophan synthase beta chain